MVVVVGAPACGKTTVGRALAEELGVGFTETDADVAAQLHLPVAEIFLIHGEAVFRRAEADAVAQSLVTHKGVLAIGSGAIESEGTRALLSDEFVVWLRLSSSQAASRAGITGARPVQFGNVRSQWARLMAAREPKYAEVAKMVVDTGESDVASCVAQISDVVTQRGRDSARDHRSPGSI